MTRTARGVAGRVYSNVELVFQRHASFAPPPCSRGRRGKGFEGRVLLVLCKANPTESGSDPTSSIWRFNFTLEVWISSACPTRARNTGEHGQ